jgi:hypothetical protein
MWLGEVMENIFSEHKKNGKLLRFYMAYSQKLKLYVRLQLGKHKDKNLSIIDSNVKGIESLLTLPRM